MRKRDIKVRNKKMIDDYIYLNNLIKIIKVTYLIISIKLWSRMEQTFVAHSSKKYLSFFRLHARPPTYWQTENTSCVSIDVC